MARVRVRMRETKDLSSHQKLASTITAFINPSTREEFSLPNKLLETPPTLSTIMITTKISVQVLKQMFNPRTMYTFKDKKNATEIKLGGNLGSLNYMQLFAFAYIFYNYL